MLQKYEKASLKPLGSPEDAKEIKKFIRRQGMFLRQPLRWISPTEVMAYVDDNDGKSLGWSSEYWVITKRGTGWWVAASYVDFIAN